MFLHGSLQIIIITGFLGGRSLQVAVTLVIVWIIGPAFNMAYMIPSLLHV